MGNFSIFIYSDRRSDIQSSLYAKLTSAIEIILYNKPSSFLSQWQTTLLSSSIYTSFMGISVMPILPSPLPLISNETEPIIIIYSNFILIGGLTLDSGLGIFYGICSPDDSKTPLYYQIKNKTNISGIVVPGVNTIYNGIIPVSLLFYNLTPNTSYSVYYYASSMDMSQYARVTNVQTIQVKTSIALILFGHIILINSVLIYLFLLISIISLIYIN